MANAFQSRWGGAHRDTADASQNKDSHVPFLNSKSPRRSNEVAGGQPTARLRTKPRWLILPMAAFLAAPAFLASCGETPQKPAEEATSKPAEPAIPPDVQAGAEALLGSETQVLLFGDLAKNGKEQFLAANVVPKTPKDTIPGTVVTRAVIAEKEGDKWTELFRCDEHLKNAKGYLGLTPLEPVTGWRLQYEQDPQKGLALYLTPVRGLEDRHVLPIGVRWNPETKRYQSLDRSYEHFLLEAPSISDARSRLR